jgi:ubiquinone/menaquinone biosynthesis C-methylase UbiE
MGQDAGMTLLNPPGAYADDSKFRARQRLWQHQTPYFDIVSWVMGLAALEPGQRVLDAGCGNGSYLRALRGQPVRAVGCDLSAGMLRAAGHPDLVNADITALPLRDGAVDRVLAIHMLYHVPDRPAAIAELRRVLAPRGTCIAVTNSADHMRSVHELVERAVGREMPGWRIESPSAHAFSAENGAAQLETAFASVTRVGGGGAPVIIREAAVVADYVASVSDHYQDQVTTPWAGVVESVRRDVQAVIDRDGAFVTTGTLAAFLCR